MNYSRATYRTASALRNPVSTGSAGCLVGSVALPWHLLKVTAIVSWYLVKWTAVLLYLMAAGLYVLATKGGPAAADVFRKSRHQFHVGTGEITEGDARDLDALAAEKPLRPGQWYPGHGVISKECN